MKTRYGRKSGLRTQEEISIPAIQMGQDGESPEKVFQALGSARACIYRWLARYRAGGWHGLRTGSRTGQPGKLDGSHLSWIYRAVVDKDPFR